MTAFDTRKNRLAMNAALSTASMRVAAHDGAGGIETGVIAAPGLSRVRAAPERLPAVPASAMPTQSSRTYSKSMGWWLTPLEGGAIQLAKRPGPVTASGISERT